MKLKYIINFFASLLTAVFISCSNGVANDSQTNNETSINQNLDTLLDKYCGHYESGVKRSSTVTFQISIGKFPKNSVFQHGNSYLTIDPQLVGKYFIVEDFFSYNTGQITNFANGFIAPREGAIIYGINEKGELLQKHYSMLSNQTGSPAKFDLGTPSCLYGKIKTSSDGSVQLTWSNMKYKLDKK